MRDEITPNQSPGWWRPRRRRFYIWLALPILVLGPLLFFRCSAAVRETSTPGESAPAGGELVTVAGRAVYVRRSGPRDRLSVAFIHGTMAWSGTWRDVFDDVAAAGYDTVAFDVPPFGFSERPADHDYSRRAQAEHIRATIDTLGIGPVVLVGHSFGGAATVEAAMQEDPSRVIGLALLDAALGLLDPQPSGPPMPWLFAAEPVRNVVMASSFTNPWAIGPGLRAFTFDPANVTDERIALYREPLVLAGTTEAIGHWFVDGLFGDPEGSASSTPEAYRSFARPVLLVWGREDSVTPLAQGAHLHGLFPSSELVILDEVNHIPHVEAPERTLAHLLAFLERVRGD